MDLTLLFDHRFYRNPNGIIFSPQNYHYALFSNRYLQVFDRVRILARVAESPEPYNSPLPAIGDRVEVVSLETWQGPAQFIRKRSVVRTIRQHLARQSAIIMVAPGIVGFSAYNQLIRSGHPYAVEVVGDPHEAFGPTSIQHPLRPFFRWWFSAQLRRQCAGACAVAYVTQATLQRRYPPNPGAFTTHYSSVELPDAAFASTPRSDYCRSDDSFTLVTVASMSQHYKGQDILIQAVSTLVQSGMNLRLVLVGEGKYRAQLESLVSQLGLGNRVHFEGQLPAGETVRKQLDQADLFVLPSRTEGLPRAMIEAMARGLPCIGTAVGGTPELLPDDDLVPPNDAPALAHKIAQVLGNTRQMAQMSARNLQKAGDYREAVLRQRRLSLYQYLGDKTQEWLDSNA